MGKKGQRNEPVKDAFLRMNFLYQASHLMAKSNVKTQLPGTYGLLLREISKKVVEKLHPELKRSLCLACNHPLTPGHANVRVEPCFKRKNKSKRTRKKRRTEAVKVKCENTRQSTVDQASDKHIRTPRVAARNKYPNKVTCTCLNCGFSRSVLQRPSHELWIDNKNAECQ